MHSDSDCQAGGGAGPRAVLLLISSVAYVPRQTCKAAERNRAARSRQV